MQNKLQTDAKLRGKEYGAEQRYKREEKTNFNRNTMKRIYIENLEYKRTAMNKEEIENGNSRDLQALWSRVAIWPF